MMEICNNICKKWNLKHIYTSVEVWNKSFHDLEKKLADFNKYKGEIKKSGIALINCLSDRCDILIEKEKIVAYAALLNEIETDINNNRKNLDRALKLANDIYLGIAFVDPEIAEINENDIMEYQHNIPSFEDYREYITYIRQRAKNYNLMTEEQERILLTFSSTFESFKNIYSSFNNYDISFKKIIIGDKSKPLNKDNYYSFIEDENRLVRKQAYKKLHQPYYELRHVLAENLLGFIRKEDAFSRINNYDSVLQMRERNGLDYIWMIENLNKYLPLHHKYLDIKSKKLRIKKLKAYDLYVPIVVEPNIKFEYEEIISIIYESLRPLGLEYCEILNKLITDGYIYIEKPEDGGQNMDYVLCSYAHLPYIKFLYQPIINRAFALTHKIGHAVTIGLTNKKQIYLNSQIDPVIEEVSAFVNEIMFLKYMQKLHRNTEFEYYFIYLYIEKFRRVVFRQSLFAEFELTLYDMINKNESLNTERLIVIYEELYNKYYGNRVQMDKYIGIEWIRLPHLYSGFLVHKFILAYVVAMLIVEKIYDREEGYIEKYLQFLSAGSSVDLHKALLMIDVDLADSHFMDKIMSRINDILDNF